MLLQQAHPMPEWRTMNEKVTMEDTQIEEPMDVQATQEEQPIGVQAMVVLKYLEEIHGALNMLSSNLSSQIKSLTTVINEATKENTSND